MYTMTAMQFKKVTPLGISSDNSQGLQSSRRSDQDRRKKQRNSPSSTKSRVQRLSPQDIIGFLEASAMTDYGFDCFQNIKKGNES